MKCEHRARIFTILQHPPFYREITKQLLKKLKPKQADKDILMKFSSFERVLRLQ